MATEGFSRTDVPTYSSGAERVDELRAACEAEQPFVVVGPMKDDHIVAYDMATVEYNLTTTATKELRDLFEEMWEEYQAELESPQSELEELTFDRPGKMNGSLYPIERSDALDTAAAISSVVLDEENWIDATE